MSVIWGIMKSEYERLSVALDIYSKRVSEEVKGSPNKKIRGKKEYLYLEKREGPRVISKYVGEIHSFKAIQIMESIKRRRKNEESLNRVKKDIKDVKRVLRGKI